jgi:nitrogen regulatory protein P-II 1
MKKIEAIIREEKLGAVKDAIEKIGISGMTVIDVKGRGAQRGISLQWRAGEYRIEFLPKKMLILVVKDSESKKVVKAICEAAGSDSVGDGKIFITPIEDVIRIRTGESGEKAL